jgi:hypothetical protein
MVPSRDSAAGRRRGRVCGRRGRGSNFKPAQVGTPAICYSFFFYIFRQFYIKVWFFTVLRIQISIDLVFLDSVSHMPYSSSALVLTLHRFESLTFVIVFSSISLRLNSFVLNAELRSLKMSKCLMQILHTRQELGTVVS